MNITTTSDPKRPNKDHNQPGDRIFLFGFSRRAYTVRVLAGLLHGLALMPAAHHGRCPVKGWMRLGGLAIAVLQTSCAVHYQDSRGTDHLWGFGHMKMNVTPPNEGVQAISKSTETLGIHVETGREEYGAGVGWNRQTRTLISTNTSVRIERPSGSLFNFRVGTKPPEDSNTQNKGGDAPPTENPTP